MAKANLAREHWVLALLFVTVLFGVMLYLYYFYPEERIGPRQPIYFSHRIHAGVKEISSGSVILMWIGLKMLGFHLSASVFFVINILFRDILKS